MSVYLMAQVAMAGDSDGELDLSDFSDVAIDPSGGVHAADVHRGEGEDVESDLLDCGLPGTPDFNGLAEDADAPSNPIQKSDESEPSMRSIDFDTDVEAEIHC